jgi:hypothetical protein
MKSIPNSGRTANFPLTPFTVAKTGAKVVPHPLSKLTGEWHVAPPDEETLLRLNAMAGKYPFCIRHRTNNSNLL